MLLCIIAFVLFLALFIILVPIPYSVKATFNGTFKDYKLSVKLYGIPLPINWLMKRGKKKKGKDKDKHAFTNESDAKSSDNDKKEEPKEPDKKEKKGLKEKASGIKNTVGTVIGMLKDKENIGIIVKTLKHIRPRKIAVDMVIGLGEPDQTGLLFGGLGILMMAWPGKYKIYPDFEEKIVKGKVRIKGIASVILIAIYALKLFKALERSKKDGREEQQ